MIYRVEEFMKEYGERLGLEVLAGKKGMKRKIRVPEAHRPGLALCGYLKGHVAKRVLIFGKAEIEYLRDLDAETRTSRLHGLLPHASETPAVIVARRYKPPKELATICERNNIPLLRASMATMTLLNSLTHLLTESFAPSTNCHGTLVEVYGVGVLIQGDTSVGKSEAALGLVERGHRLIADDVVKMKRKEGEYLEGSGASWTRHHMEIRGIGIINVAHLYGAVCVREYKSIDVVVKLEVWEDRHFYDRVGLEEKFTEILGVKLPHLVLPVKPGRDVVLLLETIALNHRLKRMGYNSAQEFNVKLMEMIASNQRKRMRSSEVST